MATAPTSERKIGDIAELTGMTVRTLRYYEEIELIEPSSRTEAGHRLYGPDAVEQLYKISMLRQLGLSLAEVRSSLVAEGAETAERSAPDLRSLMAEHLAAVDERLTNEQRLRRRLVELVGTLQANEDTTRDLLSVLEDMTMLEPKLDRRIAILVYEDIEAAYNYLTEVFGFGPGSLTRDPDGNVVHGEIQAGDGEFWLHTESPEFGLSQPTKLGGASGTMAIMVGDVDAHHAYAAERGADVRYEPVDQPYGYREYSAVDIGGHLWSFMKPLGGDA